MSSETCMDILVGKVARELRLDRYGERFLIVDTDQGSFCFETGGDCCSESWFSDFTGVAALLSGLPITKVEEVELVEEEGGRSRQEHDQILGWRLEVAGAGACKILFRNSSNGYYGGWCNRVDAIPETATRTVAEDLTVPTEPEESPEDREKREERVKRNEAESKKRRGDA